MVRKICEFSPENRPPKDGVSTVPVQLTIRAWLGEITLCVILALVRFLQKSKLFIFSIFFRPCRQRLNGRLYQKFSKLRLGKL